jgi:hypothetical protein
VITFTLLGAASSLAAPAQPALPPTVKRDVQCFVLYSIAVANSAEAKDESKKQAAGLGVTYFYGKLRVGAPGLKLREAVQQETTALENDPKVKEVGESCDAEFQERGAELRQLGEDLQGAD